jgi:hypothetical protein
MQVIKPKTSYTDFEHMHETGGKQFFDPMCIDGITPRCVCGYILIKLDDKKYRCEGGNHQYNMEEGDVSLDKFGNAMLKIPGDLDGK